MTTTPSPRPWSRRGFLVATGGALTAGVLPACTEAAPVASSATDGIAGHSMDGMRGMDPGGALDAQALTTPGSVGFVEPPVRSSTGGPLATTLRMAKTPVTIGTQTVQAVTYEASYPAPTLEIRPGDTLAVRLVNDGDVETNLHTHGLHVSPSGSSDNVLLDIKGSGSTTATPSRRTTRAGRCGTTRTCTRSPTSRCSAAGSACSSCGATSTSSPAAPAARSGS